MLGRIARLRESLAKWPPVDCGRNKLRYQMTSCGDGGLPIASACRRIRIVMDSDCTRGRVDLEYGFTVNQVWMIGGAAWPSISDRRRGSGEEPRDFWQ